MKKNEFLQIKGLDLKELRSKAQALKAEIADLTLDKNMKKLKDLKMVSKKRKDLAQILTVARQKELLAELELISSQPSVVSLQTEKEVSEGEKVTNKASHPRPRIKSGMTGRKSLIADS